MNRSLGSPGQIDQPQVPIRASVVTMVGDSTLVGRQVDAVEIVNTANRADRRAGAVEPGQLPIHEATASVDQHAGCLTLKRPRCSRPG